MVGNGGRGGGEGGGEVVGGGEVWLDVKKGGEVREGVGVDWLVPITSPGQAYELQMEEKIKERLDDFEMRTSQKEEAEEAYNARTPEIEICPLFDLLVRGYMSGSWKRHSRIRLSR